MSEGSFCWYCETLHNDDLDCAQKDLRALVVKLRSETDQFYPRLAAAEKAHEDAQRDKHRLRESLQVAIEALEQIKVDSIKYGETSGELNLHHLSSDALAQIESTVKG